ncbi:hypothetical protein Acsp01_01270 [Actinoplanes sp. NBRC 101535]|nr:hypothetical protein Acsp01_01270 [Actinoplanes sp. NBRC 101535]
MRLLVRRLPYDSEIVTLGPSPVPLTLAGDGIPVHRLHSHCDHDPAAIGRLRRLMIDGRYDVVHTHLFRAGVQGRIAARMAGVPHVVATEHHLGSELVSSRRRALYLTGERLGQVTIAASPAIAGRLTSWGVPRSRIAMIPKAIDTGEFGFDPALRAATRGRLGIAPGEPVVGGIGRLEPGKRFDLLIRAVGEVPGATLLLVGDGPARTALERLADIEGVADRVRFTGAVGHAREMLCAMDVFVSPGQESFGVATLEAVAAGLPALYAACPPLEDRAARRAPVRGTHRLAGRDRESLPRALRAELLCLTERRGARLPARTVSSRYGADHLAASVGRIYERITERPGRRRVIAPLLTFRGRIAGKNRIPLPGGNVRNA